MDKPDWQVKFEQFWQAWPQRITGSGRAVKMGYHGVEVWFRVKKPDDELFAWLMSSLKHYAQATDKRYIKDADRWLKDYRWQDFDAPKVIPQLPETIKTKAVQIARKMDVTPKLTAEQEFEQSRQMNAKLVSTTPEQRVAAMRDAADKGNDFAKQWLQRQLAKPIRKPGESKLKTDGHPLRADFRNDEELRGGT